jgi:hypothetical protein
VAAENIDNTVDGSGFFPTKVPGLSDAADIQAALRLYHYGSYTYDGANTNKANLVNPSIAKHLQTLVDADATEVVNRNSAISTHNADTTDVHGIADTSLLATKSYVDTGITSAINGATGAYSDLAGNGIDWNSVDERFDIDPKILNFSTAITKDSSFTLEESDVNKTILLDTSSSMTLTIPSNSSVAIPVGYQYNFIEIGTGRTTFAPDSGVVIGSKNSQLFLDGRYSKGTVVKVSTDTWVLYGDIYEGVASPTPTSPTPTSPTPTSPTPTSPTPTSPTPVAPTPVAPTPVAPTPVAPTPVAPTPVEPANAWYAVGCCNGSPVYGSSNTSEANARDNVDAACVGDPTGPSDVIAQYGTTYPSIDCSTTPTPVAPTPAAPTPVAPTPTASTTYYLAQATIDFQNDTCVSAPAYVSSTTTQPATVGSIFSVSSGSRTATSGYYSTISASDAVSQLLAGTSQCQSTPTPVAPTPVAPTPVAPTPVAPTPVAPTPVAPTPTQDCTPVYSYNEYRSSCGASVPIYVNPCTGAESYTCPSPAPVAPTPVAPTPVAPTPSAYCYCAAYGYAILCSQYCPSSPTPVAPTPVAPTPVAPTPVAPTPVAPTPTASCTPNCQPTGNYVCAGWAAIYSYYDANGCGGGCASVTDDYGCA